MKEGPEKQEMTENLLMVTFWESEENPHTGAYPVATVTPDDVWKNGR